MNWRLPRDGGERRRESGAEGAGAGLTGPAPSTPGNLLRKLPRKTAVRVGDTAMFCVELAVPVGPVRWVRNQEEVVTGGRVAISAEGTRHTLTISQCCLEDVGQVVFMAGDCRTSTQFCVSGEGLRVFPGWRRFPAVSLVPVPCPPLAQLSGLQPAAARRAARARP